MEDFFSSAKFTTKMATSIAKAMENFWASTKFKDKKADFVIATYKEPVKDSRDMVTTQCPILDLDFWMSFSHQGMMRLQQM